MEADDVSTAAVEGRGSHALGRPLSPQPKRKRAADPEPEHCLSPLRPGVRQRL